MVGPIGCRNKEAYARQFDFDGSSALKLDFPLDTSMKYPKPLLGVRIFLIVSSHKLWALGCGTLLPAVAFDTLIHFYQFVVEGARTNVFLHLMAKNI